MASGAGWDDLAAWPGAVLGEPLGGGTVNEVRAVDVGGRRLVARLSRRDVADLDWEIALLGRLQEAGLGVPRLVPSADGHLRAGRIVVMDRFEGAQPDGPADWAEVAAYLHRLHDVTEGWPQQRPGWSGCAELVTADRSGPVDVGALPADVAALCRRTWARLPARPPAVVHGDPNPTNIRIHDGNVVFLDWDEARVDNPLLDFVYADAATAGLSPEDHRLGQQAFYAWEAAMFWHSAPEHAQRRLARIERDGPA